MTQPFLVDSYAPLTEAAVAHLLTVTGGRLPAAWGRYTDADLSRDLDVAAAHGIPLMLIARRSGNVPFAAAGRPNGDTDRARVERIAEQAKAVGARILRSVWLDVEMRPTMAQGYWRGWSAAFDGSPLTPCVYMPNRNWWPDSWRALEADVAAGARCGGVWVALYRQPSDGSAVFREEPWSARPKASDAVPYLAWQHTGNAYQQRYDFSVVNPDASIWLTDCVGDPPIAEVPRASAEDPAPLTSAAQAGPYSEVP